MNKVVLAVFIIICLRSISAIASPNLTCDDLLSSDIKSILENALENDDDLNGAIRIINYKNIKLVRNEQAKSFINAMKGYVEKNVNLEVDSSAVSIVGQMKVSATIVIKSSTGEILGGSIEYFQEGAQHPSQFGNHVSRAFKNRRAAVKAGYAISTGWSFMGAFDNQLNKFGWWDPDNHMSFNGY